MKKLLVIAENPFEPWTWERLEVDDIRETIVQRYPQWPETARLYHKYVAQSCDVTPCDIRTVERLEELDGPIFLIIYPGNLITLIIIAAVAIAALIVFAFVFKPAIPTGNNQASSPNNELAQRSNNQRLGSRIPDIFGQVRSTPDLIHVPYSIFENNQEVEYSYMCIGKGTYDISDVRDGATLISDIAGASAIFYGPNTSPNSGAPQMSIGSAITEPLKSVKRFSQVNGQVLRAPNANQVTAPCVLIGPDQIHLDPNAGSTVDFTAYFGVGDALSVTDAGIYNVTTTVLSVSNNLIVLSNPGSTNSNWNTLSTSVPSSPINMTLSTSSDKWVGPFTIDMSNATSIIGNFIAAQGCYKIDVDNNQFAADVNIEFEITPIFPDGSQRCPGETGNVWIRGSSTLRTQCAATGVIFPQGPGICRVRARRTTPYDTGWIGSVMDEVKWRDVYGAASVSNSNFGDVTTVYTKTYATAGALAVKERRFNCLVTRKIPRYLGNKTFSSSLVATQDAADIFSFVCLDPKIGNRVASEIDFDQIYQTIAEVKAYFGSAGQPKAAWFNYTFDNDNISFEETASTIAQAAFCMAYRRGNVIKLSFERDTTDSVLLFNHRNKIPGTEVRSVNFGTVDDNDGVELEYVNPVDDSKSYYYIPEDKSALNPKKIETVGIRSRVQAYYHAYRAWNKIRYQNVTIEFEATQEADLLVIQDRILVADNTRPDTQDGEIISQNGLELYLSQPVTVSGSTYNIFLQHADATVESIPITAGSDNRRVVLGRAPKAPLALDEGNFARTTYMIVNG